MKQLHEDEELGKHYSEIANPDYIGFDHYRRFLDWKPSLLKPVVVLLTKNAILHPARVFLGESHGDAKHYVDVFMQEFRNEFGGDEYADIEDFWRTHLYYGCNCFITDRATFLRYSDFIAHCMQICKRAIEREKDKLARLSSVERRKNGFIMELVGGCWSWHERRAGRVKVKGAQLRFYNFSNTMNGTSYPARGIK